ncbi:MAG: PAS domain-containing protein [Azospirillaceae bacterium]
MRHHRNPSATPESGDRPGQRRAAAAGPTGTARPRDTARPGLPPRDALSPATACLLGYWQRLAPHTPVPCKTMLDPSAIPPDLLPSLTIYERKGPGVYFARLVGTGIVRRIGYDTTGSNYLDFVPETERRAAARFFDMLLDHPCGGYLVVDEVFAEGREAEVEVLRLPLTSPDGTPRFLISASEELDVHRYRDAPRRPRLMSIPRRAAYFDIGHGVPNVPVPYDLDRAPEPPRRG